MMVLQESQKRALRKSTGQFPQYSTIRIAIHSTMDKLVEKNLSILLRRKPGPASFQKHRCNAWLQTCPECCDQIYGMQPWIISAKPAFWTSFSTVNLVNSNSTSIVMYIGNVMNISVKTFMVPRLSRSSFHQQGKQPLQGGRNQNMKSEISTLTVCGTDVGFWLRSSSTYIGLNFARNRNPSCHSWRLKSKARWGRGADYHSAGFIRNPIGGSYSEMEGERLERQSPLQVWLSTAFYMKRCVLARKLPEHINHNVFQSHTVLETTNSVEYPWAVQPYFNSVILLYMGNIRFDDNRAYDWPAMGKWTVGVENRISFVTPRYC